MWNQRPTRRRAAWWACLSLLGLVLAGGGWSPSAQAAGDPVEDLRQALRLEDVRTPNEFIIAFREENLQKKINNLKTLSDLRRALILDEWKEDLGQGRNETLRKIDEQKRQEVGQRLIQAVRAAAASPDPTVRLAVANMIAEMGPTVRGLRQEDRAGFTRLLTPEVMRLAQDKDLAVRQEGLRALGTINPSFVRDGKGGDLASDLFRKELQSKDEIGPRRVAALGLAQLIKVANNLRKSGRGSSRVQTTNADVLITAQEIAKATTPGLQDPDSYIRMACLEALQQCAASLMDLTVEPFPRKLFAAEGRFLTPQEKEDIVATYETVRKDFVEINPLAQVLSQQSGLIVSSLQSDDPRVRVAGLNALDFLASARLKMKRRIESVPFVQDNKVKVVPITWDDPLASFLSKGMPVALAMIQDPDVQARRQAVVVAEILGDRAEGAIPYLARALEDSDRFVRWEAARAVRFIAPEKSAATVPGLAALLSDPDISIRQEAAATLETLGLLARPAAPAIAQTLREGDPESRMALISILNNLDPSVSQVAVPILIENLTHPDPRVRHAAAACLGRIGPLAQAAVPALRLLIGDTAAEVRVAASDALLSILK